MATAPPSEPILSFRAPVATPPPFEPSELDRELPGTTRLHLDRPVPFLCIYRRPVGAEGTAGARALVEDEAAFLTSMGEGLVHDELEAFVLDTVCAFSPRFGGFLLLEVWRGPASADGRPIARIVEQPERAPRSTIDHLADALRAVRLRGRAIEVESLVSAAPSPLGLPPILDEGTLRRQGCALVGLELSSIIPEDSEVATLPREEGEPIRNALRRGLAEFLRSHSSGPIARFVSLGPRALDEHVVAIDRALAAIDRSFDFVFQVTPVNARAAREEFFAAGAEHAPSLLYRPCPIEPDLVKRRLYDLRIESVHDPILEQVFLEKRDEIAGKLTALRDVGSPRFLHASVLLFGDVEASLLDAADSILDDVPATAPSPSARIAPADDVAARARRQLDLYRDEVPDLSSRVELRDDVVGLSVSHGIVRIADEAAIPEHRVDGLLAHEIGTHVVTFVNGAAQRLTLLATGLVGYDELQEGLAVLAEHIVGGLTGPRLRVLAGRVVGAHAMLEGASFVDTYRLLLARGFPNGEAFSITLRLYRGGGLTKDAMYLRGLLFVLDYLSRGGDVEALYLGKVGEAHLPVLEALRRHGAELRPRTMPLHLRGETAREKLARLRLGAKPQDLLVAEPNEDGLGIVLQASGSRASPG